MTGLPLELQALVWTYALVASLAILACVWGMYAGLATGRHRRRKSAPLAAFMAWLGTGLEGFLVDIGRGLTNGVEALLYGRAS
jgi:ABC-type dipeptide/oligopeptide/nickel transport system permease component